jgi:1L-myo-inositol 1-phosphate cytidylyltransferase / CDP-L-myo-inositol myo-inositolphosphotransferase
VRELIILFASQQSAAQLVAGVPAAARVLRAVSIAASTIMPNTKCRVALPGGVITSQVYHSEVARLAPELVVEIVDSDALDVSESSVLVDGEYLPDAALLANALNRKAQKHRAFPDSLGNWRARVSQQSETERSNRHNAAGWDIIRATVKAGDGIVSRHINRPISTRMTRFLLRFGWMQPIHATLAAAVVGLAMAWCLFFGGSTGLMVGAVLFQAASVIDGVDGEMARATFRSSDKGATLDSIIDGVTNLLFFAGLPFNLSQQGVAYADIAGVLGFSSLAIGLILLGRHAHKTSGSIHFEAVKLYFRGRSLNSTQALIWLTTRDFFVAISCVMAIAGLAAPLLYLFTAIAVMWLLVVIVVLALIQTEKSESKSANAAAQQRKV